MAKQLKENFRTCQLFRSGHLPSNEEKHKATWISLIKKKQKQQTLFWYQIKSIQKRIGFKWRSNGETDNSSK